MRINRNGYNAGGLGDPNLDWYGEPNDGAGDVSSECNFGFEGMAFYSNDGSDVCDECNGSRGQHALDCNAIN